jgi:hypothetical protein
MIHITHNIIAPAVMTESRIESRLPRMSLVPDAPTTSPRAAAEAAEKITSAGSSCPAGRSG